MAFENFGHTTKIRDFQPKIGSEISAILFKKSHFFNVDETSIQVSKAVKWAFEALEGAKSISASQTFEKYYFCCRQKFLPSTNVAFLKNTFLEFVAGRNFWWQQKCDF